MGRIERSGLTEKRWHPEILHTYTFVCGQPAAAGGLKGPVLAARNCGVALPDIDRVFLCTHWGNWNWITWLVMDAECVCVLCVLKPKGRA